MRTKNILIALLAIFYLTACSDDFLELTPPDAISDLEAFETLADFDAAINGIYATIRGGGGYWGKNMMMNFDVAADDAYAVIGFTNQWGTQYAWTVDASTGEVFSLFAGAYQVATRSSNLINNWSRLSEGTEAHRNHLLGEAKLARAMAHFDLVRVFAKPYRQSNPTSDLGIPIVTVENLEDKARNTIEEVFQFVITEALEAKELMKHTGAGKHPRDRGNLYFREVTSDALLARVYHEKGDWASAITHATNVIEKMNLSTGADFVNIWAADGVSVTEANNEVIFMVAVHPTEFSNAVNMGSNFVGGNPPAPPAFNWRIDYMPANDLIAMYDKANDVRFGAYFQENVPVANVPPITALIKYPPSNPNFTQRGMSLMKVFRVAEMYLIRAEAYSYSNEGSANADLSALRAARIAGYSHTNLAGEALKQAIYDERRKEMAFESSRWFDLRRRGQGFARTPQAGSGPGHDLAIESTDFRWVWPIPQHEMDANRLMRQNAGYSVE